MGPFPHGTKISEISKDNPAGTAGMAFVEFAHPDPDALRTLFARMGFCLAARHKTKDFEVWKQGDIVYLVNGENDSMGMSFAGEHGPCAPSMGWSVVDGRRAFDLAVSRGARPYLGKGKVLDVPAIVGIGGSLIYFVERQSADAIFGSEYVQARSESDRSGVGFFYLDHLTHNVRRGNMDRWCRFYSDIFNFRQIRFFNIEGKHSGLFSRALTLPCARIRIPINESADDKSQIEEYIRRYNGEGIQHIAIGTQDIYASADAIAELGMQFMPKPPRAYYRKSFERLPGHGEPIDRMEKHGILIDGEGVVEGGETKILLQVFSKTAIGPIFFEFIQRKGDDGFGEGNFKALFESIEQDQIERGVLGAS